MTWKESDKYQEEKEKLSLKDLEILEYIKVFFPK